MVPVCIRGVEGGMAPGMLFTPLNARLENSESAEEEDFNPTSFLLRWRLGDDSSGNPSPASPRHWRAHTHTHGCKKAKEGGRVRSGPPFAVGAGVVPQNGH